MKPDETVMYLANILAIARADNVLSPEEESALEQIRSEIKARKKDLKDAEKLASKSDYQPTPVGRYSDKVRNIEDMLLVAMSDGELGDSEKSRLTRFAKQTGVTQEQIRMVVSEAKARLQAATATIACPACDREIPAASKFCPECGAPIEPRAEVAATKLEFEYPHEGVSVEFAESSSASFDAALGTASAAPDFQQCLRSKKRWFMATWPRDQIMSAAKLAAELRGLRNRKAYLDGTEVPWDELFGFVWCMKQREGAFKPVEYCFGVDEKKINLWGCKQVRMDWVEWADWFTYGRFRKKNVFVFDKARIRHELDNNLHSVHHCPFLRRRLIETVFRLLPDDVRVSDRTGWQYKRSYQETPDSIKVVQKERHDGFVMTDEFYADGVAPIGFTVAREILKKAFKACGVRDIGVAQVLP